MTQKSKPKRKEINPRAVPKPAALSNRWMLITAVILTIIAVAIFVWQRFFFLDAQKQALLASLSQLDLSGIEPQVANKIKTLQQEVRSNPRSTAAWGKLAMNLDAHDFKNESLPIYKEAAKLDSTDFRWPYFCAIVFSEMGRKDALEWFERASKIDPDYVPVLVKYGDVLVQFGEKDQAVQEYQQALAYDPRSAHALFGLARVAFAEGDMETSRKNLQKILEGNPDFGEAYSLLASVCRQQKDADCVSKNSELASRFTEKSYLLDPVYAELVAEGESSIWYRYRGSEYFKKGIYEAAINEFQTALRLRPDAQSHEDLAKAFSGAGRLSEAAEQYRKALATHPAANNYFGLALVLVKMGEYAEAEEFFRKAIQKKPDFAEAYFNLAVLFAKSRRLQETLDNLKHAIRINPDYTEAHYYLGQTYLAANNPEAAVQQYKILSKLDSDKAKQLQMQIEKKQ